MAVIIRGGAEDDPLDIDAVTAADEEYPEFSRVASRMSSAFLAHVSPAAEEATPGLLRCLMRALHASYLHIRSDMVARVRLRRSGWPREWCL